MRDVDSLWSESEDERRFAIMEASRTGDGSKLPRLLILLQTDTYSNRRHVARAIGRIGGGKAQGTLLELLDQTDGLILGDIARSLGQLKVIAALPRLQSLQNHELDWVRDSARWACQEMQRTTEPEGPS
jgi:HEAT repeat protein